MPSCPPAISQPSSASPLQDAESLDLLGTALPTAAEAAAFRDFAKTLPAAMAAGKMADGSAWPTLAQASPADSPAGTRPRTGRAVAVAIGQWRHMWTALCFFLALRSKRMYRAVQK